MKHFLLLLSCIGLLSCVGSRPATTRVKALNFEQIETFPFTASIRALQAVDNNTVWWAGSNGLVGHTKDGGQSWQVDTLRHAGQPLHFRALAVTPSAVFVLSIESPALLYRTTNEGKTWQLVYQEDHPAAFYDAMKFWNDREGIAMGDPTDGCISIILTRDGGKSWQKIPCAQLPAAAAGEAAFAASNSNIALHGENAWVVTGGAKARVLHSPDKGRSWTITQSPLKEGGQMTGIYTVAFRDAQHGILFGGDWNEMESNVKNKAITTDGGKSWRLLADGDGPGYRSCVEYFPGSRGKGILAVGIPGISVSQDGGQRWETVSKESWYAASFTPAGDGCWLSGGNKIGKVGK